MNVSVIAIIVAIVFFLIICVVSISSWRRGNKVRNAAIKAIEQSINDVAYELSEMNITWKNTYNRIDDLERRREEEKQTIENEKSFVTEKAPSETPTAETLPPGEITLDFAEFGGFEKMDLDDIELELPDSISNIDKDYITGRSGKKYTAEELEALIKE